MSDHLLNGTFPLPASFARKKTRDWDESIAGLHDLVDDPHVGLAAQTGLRVVYERGGDPRTILLIIEAAIEGYFDPQPKSERERQRNAQK